jgi:endonuclease/exonuclease/phosphatase family metal-dependent hydrolase
MFNPKLEFENDVKKFNSKLNFTYEWKIRSENSDIRNEQLDQYKDKLGYYIELYDSKQYLKDNYADIYEPYKELSEYMEKLKLLKYKIETSLENNFIKINDTANFIFKKGQYIYKGTKYFYKEEQEQQFYDQLPYGYYGDIYLAYFYARRYSGGLQVYKLKKDIKLFNITNDKNMFYILDLINQKKNSNDIYFNNVTYKEFYKAIKVKYGVGINKYFQAYNISKYTKFNEMWLYEQEGDISSYKNNSDKSYTGWYYGAGNIDRICAHGIMLLIKDKFDGITGLTGFYTPFSSTTGTEVIIWNQNEILERQQDNKYDSMQFIKKLDFDPFKINFDITMGQKNKDFKLIKFYLNNQMLSEDKIKSQLKKMPIGLKIMSLNIHNFCSINLDDTKEVILHKLLELLELYDIDICCLQEYYKNFLPVNSSNSIYNKYNIIYDAKHIGLVVFYKSNIILSDIYSFRLPNEKFLDQDRFGLFFTINNSTNSDSISSTNSDSTISSTNKSKKFCITHLEIGKRFYDRSGSLYYAEELLKIINFNYNIRIKQLNKLLDEDPDYIIGDFNFNNFDKEYEFMTNTNTTNTTNTTNKTKYYSGLTDYTTPHGKQVDFIFSKTKYDYFQKINFPYSDHLPIMAIL